MLHDKATKKTVWHGGLGIRLHSPQGRCWG